MSSVQMYFHFTNSLPFFCHPPSPIPVAAQDTQATLLNTVVQQEIAVRRQRVGISRQDSRLSVKSLIESIEKSQQQVRNTIAIYPREHHTNRRIHRTLSLIGRRKSTGPARAAAAHPA